MCADVQGRRGEPCSLLCALWGDAGCLHGPPGQLKRPYVHMPYAHVPTRTAIFSSLMPQTDRLCAHIVCKQLCTELCWLPMLPQGLAI